jgi:hypothetical protein
VPAVEEEDFHSAIVFGGRKWSHRSIEANLPSS